MQVWVRWVSIWVALSLLAPALEATLTTPLSFVELVDRSRLIFRGEVTNVRAEWQQRAEQRVIVTLVEFKVLRGLKGNLPDTLTIEFLGGTIGSDGMAVQGMPHFAPGDEDVLCLGERGALFPILGVTQGRFRVLTGLAGRRVAFADGSPVFSVTNVGRQRVATSAVPLPAMALEQFEAAVLEQVRRTSGRGF